MRVAFDDRVGDVTVVVALASTVGADRAGCAVVFVSVTPAASKTAPSMTTTTSPLTELVPVSVSNSMTLTWETPGAASTSGSTPLEARPAGSPTAAPWKLKAVLSASAVRRRTAPSALAVKAVSPSLMSVTRRPMSDA